MTRFHAIKALAEVRTNQAVSSGLLRLDVELAPPLPCKAGFLPGQFAMLNLPGRQAFVFGRPFSILDWQDRLVSFLYRVVGDGTQALADLQVGDQLEVLGPLGGTFPRLAGDQAAVLIGGGVGLPPVAAWLARFGRPQDRGYFGARDGADAPWDELKGAWQVSVDRLENMPEGRQAFHGLVTQLVASDPILDDSYRRVVLSCGPVPMLRAVAQLARERGWECLVSLEEHMGCGYGVCKGCVIPVLDEKVAAGEGFRNATCCEEGPVFRAENVLWERYDALPTVD
jgi:dihydroorotate dehydrogenase electron transfer subunit